MNSAPTPLNWGLLLCNIGFISLISSFFACDTTERNLDRNFKKEFKISSKPLQKEIDDFINYNDSITILPNRSSIESYWLIFEKQNSIDKLFLVANFDFYNSEKMEGYFLYKDKYISVYTDSLSSASKLLDTEALNKTKIPLLVDYSSKDSDIPPHNPPLLVYEIIEDSLLILIEDRK